MQHEGCKRMHAMPETGRSDSVNPFPQGDHETADTGYPRKAMTIGVLSLYCGYASVKKSTEVHNTHKRKSTMGSKHPRTLHIAV